MDFKTIFATRWDKVPSDNFFCTCGKFNVPWRYPSLRLSRPAMPVHFFFSWHCEQVSMFFGSYSKSTSSSAFILSQELVKRLFSVPPCHCYHHWIVLTDRNAPPLAFYLKLSELGKLCHFSFFFSSYAFYSLGDGPHFLWGL